ncbi:AMP-binding protein [Propionibacterium freudenreichii]|uniref:AMP-binding protein n=1 Tax=Propionibacterium freudenreichii TaxID=1744 RepID=UPI000BC327BE|nr:AMP-binding protein [Propionibacterium freudenreichii]WFF31534.1 AMP-binding protein [Propionibacterium freudenreichii]WGU89567.1 AMP-binding protein [Propionibacterium freudenreichii]SCQ72624.1 O-succinylbenzoic acid-CoA ligase menE [Propionibacterium freudenreichii]SCQ81014.1 O-succinylbenzoic acid-CoA ligase menE [Propionibacterium freudenreichii]
MTPDPASRVQLLRVERTQSSIDALAGALHRLLCERESPVLMPLGPDEDPVTLHDDLVRRMVRLPDDVRLVMRTSGSTTGHGRLVGLSAAQLRASIRATDQRLGGPARWLLTLPAHHIAGLQVVARSVLDGTRSGLVHHLDAASLTTAVDAARAGRPEARVNLSLVPTQLRDLLGDAAGRDALRSLSAVLVGGAATDRQLVDAALAAGIALHLSYGMSETCGGCVYDGRPLRGVELSLGERPDAASDRGRIWIAGPMVMSGYLDGDPGVTQLNGTRWLATSDLGHLHHGRLEVSGRVDDVIITGGLKVAADQVRAAVLSAPMVAQAAVVALPHPRWGQVVSAVVVPTDAWTQDSPAALRDLVGELLGRQLAPRVVVVTDHLPTLASGKLDRLAVRNRAEQVRRDGGAWTSD